MSPTPKVIISYDGTRNDEDALALGRVFGDAGSTLELAYVRHASESDPERERSAQQHAEDLLERGARSLGSPEAPRHVVMSGSTGHGLGELAERELASAVVLGSEYRTTPGQVAAGTSAQRLLEGGAAAVALAPAGERDSGRAAFAAIAVVDGEGDSAARETAEALARSSGASAVELGEAKADLLVLGSSPGMPVGRVLVSSRTRYLIETARCPVLVVARGTAIAFGARG